MGFGKQLRVQRSADGRVLKSQLDLTAEALRATRLSAPAWAFVIAWLASDQVGHVGNVPILRALLVPAFLGATMVTLDYVVSYYRRDTSGPVGHERTDGWFRRLVTMQCVISVVWGLMPWLLWDHASDLNHLFVAASTSG